MESKVPRRAVPHLGRLTWREAEAALRPETVVLVPTGAIEAHGPHLPLDSDAIIALATAERAATVLLERDDSAIVAPTLLFGVSYVGTCFPGTAPLPPNVLREQLVGVVAALARWGPRRFAVVNAHLEPAHVAALREAIAVCEEQHGVRVAFADQREDRWAAKLSDEFRRGARHAGSYETSIVLAAAPERVRRDLLPTLPPVWIDLPARLRAGATTFAEAGGTEGYFGDPARATAEEGEALLDALAAMTVEAIDDLASSPPAATAEAT
jgi:creatinine amidohydrolase